MPPARFIRLKPEEDARLREIEQDAHLRPKVRVRAQVLRLSSQGETMQGIAAYTNRSPASIGRDLDRWEGHGLEGLADKTAPGNPTRLTQEVKIFMEEKLAQERTWNARQLAEAVEGRFGIGVGAETIPQHLLRMGYSWKRTRYVPSKPPDPEKEREAREELAALREGPRRGRSS